MERPTFKKVPKPTGLAAIRASNRTEIKYKKKECGMIDGPSWRVGDDFYRIRLIIEKEVTKEEPCPFKWVTLKAKFETEKECREYLIEKWEAILKDLKIYFYLERD